MWAPPRVDGTLKDSDKLLSVIPLNSQVETKIKTNGKPCQILVDTRTYTLHCKLHSLESVEWDSGETGRSQPKVRIPTKVSSS